MAATGIASPAILGPMVLPQVAFSRADDFLALAAQLREKAGSLKVRAKENEGRAEQYEKAAAKLQTNAEDDREHIQAELDNTLEYYADVLEDFLLIPDNSKELEVLTVGVEEGRSYVHEVVTFGEKLLQFKAAKPHLSQQNGANLFRNDFRIETNVNQSSRTTDKAEGRLEAYSAPTIGIFNWRNRIGSLLRRVSYVDRLAPSSLKKLEIGDTSMELHQKGSGSVDAFETQDCPDHERRNLAQNSRNQSDIALESISIEVLNNPTLLAIDQTITTDTGLVGQIQSKKETKPSANDMATYANSGVQTCIEEDSTLLDNQETIPETSRKRRRKNSNSVFAEPAPKRCREVEDLTEEEKAAAFSEHEALTRYRELFMSMYGKHEVKRWKTIKSEMAARINNSKLSVAKKKRLIVYVKDQVNAMVRENEKEATEKEKAAIFNEPDALARYRELKAAPYGTRVGAKERLKQEMTSKIADDDTISLWKKHKLTEHMRDQVNVLAKNEHERLKKEGMARREHERMRVQLDTVEERGA